MEHLPTHSHVPKGNLPADEDDIEAMVAALGIPSIAPVAVAQTALACSSVLEPDTPPPPQSRLAPQILQQAQTPVEETPREKIKPLSGPSNGLSAKLRLSHYEETGLKTR